MYKILLSILIIFAAFGLNAQGIQLDDLIEKAQNYSPQKAQLSLIAEGSEMKIKELSSQNLPQTMLGGQASWQSEVTSFPVSIPGVDIALPPKDRYQVTLDLQQNIWDGGLTSSQKAMVEAGQKVEEKMVATDLFKIEEQVSNLYFLVLFAERQKVNVDLSLKELNTQIARIEAALENGIAIKSDLYALEAKSIELDQSLIEIDKRKGAAIKSLGILTGEAISEDANFEAPSDFELNELENHRPELAFLSAQQESIGVSEQFVKAKNLPKISLFATGGYGKPGLNFLASDFSTYMMGGLKLKVPLSHLYNGGKTSEIQQLKINQMRLEKDKENFLMASEVQWATQNAEVERLESLLENDQKLIVLREQIRLTADAQLENGVITASDYLLELNREDRAKQTLVLHEVQLLQAKQNRKYILGQ